VCDSPGRVDALAGFGRILSVRPAVGRAYQFFGQIYQAEQHGNVSPHSKNKERRRKPMPTTFAILAAIYCLVVAPIAVALAPSDRRPQSAPAARRSAKAHT